MYRVIFYNQNQVFELYVKQIYHSDMYGFIEVEEYVFGERSQTIVDPAEEKLKTAFKGVKRSYIPLHSVVRIDEVEEEGQVTITDTDGKSNITQFPGTPFKMPGSGDES